MEYRFSAIGFPDIGLFASFIINNNFILVDLCIRHKFPVNHHIWCNNIIVTHNCLKFCIIIHQPGQIFQMLILRKTARFYGIPVTEFYDFPFSGAKILQFWKGVLKKLHIYLLELCSGSLSDRFFMGFSH